MAWQPLGNFTFKALGTASQHNRSKVKSVRLLGHGKVKFRQNADGLTVAIPEATNQIAPVFRISF